MFRILVVDDDKNTRLLLKAVLESANYTVSVATDGLSALSVMDKEHIDLAIIDVMMPNMDGWDTLKAIRKNKLTERIPVIMITAVSEDQKVVSGLKIGADDYIVKPFILPNLLARIEAVLRRSNWQKDEVKKDKALNNDVNIEVLTPKEKEVLSYVAKGASNQEIADKLCVRDVTIKTHLNNIFKKLKVTNRTQAVLVAMQIDLIN